jgi:4-hydroxythreonine-4-phosphate dehydrogenase
VDSLAEGLALVAATQAPEQMGLPVFSPDVALVNLPEWGQPTPAGSWAAYRAIEYATNYILKTVSEIASPSTSQLGLSLGLVTAPIHKAAMQRAGAPYTGHTECLQALASAHFKRPISVRMMLVNQELTVVLHSVHVPLRQAIESLDSAALFETIAMTQAALESSSVRPRIAVAGLNPHAGEEGLMGTEEARLIQPAIARAQAQNWAVSGPWPPDTVFMQARQGRFDAVIALYHDQGLIPIKYLGLEHGVNLTLGLPFIRSSPDHGTAFDLAGTLHASCASLEAALAWHHR